MQRTPDIEKVKKLRWRSVASHQRPVTGNPPRAPIPADLVEASASGLDPDISVAAAYYQIPRIAKARGLSQATVQQIVDAHIEGRFLGLFGEPRVNVLELNMALAGISGQSS